MKVEQFYNKNQFHLYGEGKDILQSYDSTVVVIDRATGSITLGEDWDYSTTTSKHVYLFLEDYGNMNFYGVSNKRKYIRDLINDDIIKYDSNLR